MGKPVNLNRYRKNKARADKKARANENAVKFGLSKAERDLERAHADKTRRDLDAHERDE